jgi:hypothetical protein
VVLLAVLPIAVSACGGSSAAGGGTSSARTESVGAVQAAIRKLPYELRVRHSRVDRDALVIEVHDQAGGEFKYFVFAGGGVTSELGIKGVHPNRMINVVALSPHFSVAFNDESSGETGTQQRERRRIDEAITDAVCTQTKNGSCGI